MGQLRGINVEFLGMNSKEFKFSYGVIRKPVFLYVPFLYVCPPPGRSATRQPFN